MFGEVAHTPQDIQFQIFGIPCRIHPFFWIISAIFAFPGGNQLPGSLVLGFTLVGMACLLISILVHELGHAVLIRRAGFQPSIVLHGFGGYAQYQPQRSIRPATLIAISFAGPGAGFILYGIVCGLEVLLMRADIFHRIPVGSALLLGDAIMQLKYINLFWGLINLLPIYPLDGGQIARTWLGSRWGLKGVRQSLVVSIIASGGAALWFYQAGGHQLFSFPVVLFGILCFQSIQAYQELGRY